MFKKYPSIENTYRDKNLRWWTERFPELESETFVIQEKIDGSNLQVVFSPTEPLRLFSRNQEIDKTGDTFSWVWSLVNDKYADEFSTLQLFATNNNIDFRLYGEMYGHMNRVYYGKEKGIVFFDIVYGLPDDLEWGSQHDFNMLMQSLHLEHMKVPTLVFAENLQDALEYPNDKFSVFTSEKPNGEPNIMEGVVIKPYYQVYQTEQGSIFYLKNKNEKFSEGGKTKKEPVVLNSKVEQLKEAFQEYINEARVLSVFSKEGEIQSPKDIGKYLQLVLADATEDFLEDHPEAIGLDKKEMGQVTNAKSVVDILKRYL